MTRARRGQFRNPKDAPPYERRVFINCPFDDQYLSILHAIMFTVLDCGFSPQVAAQRVDGQLRLTKLVEMMRQSRLAIHDISRLPAKRGQLPRFNMPFECGLFYGLRQSGAAQHQDKEFLVLDAKAHRHQRTLSDAAGLDPKVHNNRPRKAVDAVRHFLGSELKRLVGRAEHAPGGEAIWRRYQRFKRRLYVGARRPDVTLTYRELMTFDYLTELADLMEKWIRAEGS